MSHGEKKIAKIIEELTMFFFSVGAHRIKSGIEILEGQAVISLWADYDKQCRSSLKYMEECFGGEKNQGIEDFYWELAGSGEPGEASQLLLVGMMVDKAEIRIEEKEVSLKLYKNIEDGYI